MVNRCPDCHCLTSSAPSPCPECMSKRLRYEQEYREFVHFIRYKEKEEYK
jgi:RNA polymerase subunit RPABC4/transcription elongation factor Spt4